MRNSTKREQEAVARSLAQMIVMLEDLIKTYIAWVALGENPDKSLEGAMLIQAVEARLYDLERRMKPLNAPVQAMDCGVSEFSPQQMLEGLRTLYPRFVNLKQELDKHGPCS